jgi:hypothetical protein
MRPRPLLTAAGLVSVYTDLKKPDFGRVAKAMGLWGAASRGRAQGVRSDLVRAFQPGAAVGEGETEALRDAVSPFVTPEAVVGISVHTARANPATSGRCSPRARLIPSVETEIARSVSSEDDDNV